MNGDGLLNSNNILWESSIINDVENVLAVKATDVDEIDTKEKMLPAHSLSLEEWYVQQGFAKYVLAIKCAFDKKLYSFKTYF